MSESGLAARRNWPLPLRVLMARPRLLLSLIAGLCVFFALPALSGDLRGVTRFLLAWDLGTALYLALAFLLFARSDTAQIRRQAVVEDEGSIVILLLTIGACIVSFGAVFAWLELATRQEIRTAEGFIFLYATVMLSWALIHTTFALHYAHEYYGDGVGKGGGLIFPHDPEPDYFDFVYFAFSIGTSTEASDVAISARRIRRTVTLHGIVAFFFNVTVLALTVGLMGDAIQN